MVVVDNADQLDWGVERLVPTGKAGSVIVTSQDGHVSQLLASRSGVVIVEEMKTDEACSLLLRAVDEDRSSASGELLTLSTRIVDMLDRLNLAVDLAAARIGSDVDNSDEVQGAMHRYLTDFQRHQDRLLQSREYVECCNILEEVLTYQKKFSSSGGRPTPAYKLHNGFMHPYGSSKDSLRLASISLVHHIRTSTSVSELPWSLSMRQTEDKISCW
ncbi:hypothetical protein LTR49_028489, partial [Elasticomyces elasticus]